MSGANLEVELATTIKSSARAGAISWFCGKSAKPASAELYLRESVADSTPFLRGQRFMNPFSQNIEPEGGLPRWKRVLDISFILLMLPLLIPLAIAIAVIIRMVSNGPILFQQERVGYLGRRFMCLKFRTMFLGSDTGIHQGHLEHLLTSDAPMVKMDAKGDARIIPFGLLLRSSGLDELPQLINILRGEMSLVGPRPCLQYESEKYLPWQKERFNAVPGLTGLWQVNGKNRTTFIEMIQWDIRYARTKSLGLDLKIIAKTIPALAVQMLDTRKRQKSVSRNTPRKTILPVSAVNQ